MARLRRLAAMAAFGLVLLPLIASTGAFAATLPSYYNDVPLVSGLNQPRSLAFFPNGTILLVENAGRISLVNNTTRTTLATFTGLATAGEQGLLGVAIDPDYPARPFMYVHYTASTSPSHVQVARLNITNSTGPGPLGIDLTSKLIYLSDMPNVNTNHNGGTVRFGPDKDLYISIGDDATGGCDAQNISWMAGKILRIKVDDTVDPANRLTLAPTDNPFYNASDANASLVWALGLRNPFRFDIDPTTGLLVIGDVGQSSWEEVDVSAGGENFGWPYFEGNHSYSGALCPGQSAVPAWTRPIFEYPNPGGASVIMATVYRGVNYPIDLSLPPEFNGNAFFFDYSSGNLRVLRPDVNGTNWSLVAGVDAVNFGTGMTQVPDMRVGPDGALYWPTDSTGELRRIGYQSVPQVLTASLSPGTVSAYYSANLSASGNAPPYTWSIGSGALPDGLALNATTGEIKGTPTVAGMFAFNVTVQSSVGRTGFKNLSISVADPVSIAPASLADAVQNQSYIAPLAALGGVPPFLWSLQSGALPPGMSLTPSSGHIQGTAAQFGVWIFAVRATDADGRYAAIAYSLRVIEALRILNTSLPQGLQGSWYEVSLAAAGGTAPYTWDVNASVALPPGLSLGAANGTLFGTPAGPSASSIPFELRDSGGQLATASIDLVIAPPPGDPPLIATVTPPRATAEVAYSLTFQVAAGNPPFTWALVNGSAPPGLAFAPANATLWGTPTAVGNFSFSIRVTDNFGRADERNYTVRVDPRLRSLSVTTANLPDGELGVAFSALQFNASGVNVSLPLHWTAAGLPAGLMVSDGGVISGVPTAEGSFQVQVVARDSAADPLEAQAFYTVNVSRLHIRPVAQGDLANLLVGRAVVLPLEINQSVAGVLWSVSSGTLPPGLRLDSDGVLRGTPTASGNYTITVRATRPNATGNFDEQTLTMTVAPQPTACCDVPARDGSLFLWVVLLLLAAALVVALAWSRRRSK